MEKYIIVHIFVLLGLFFSCKSDEYTNRIPETGHAFSVPVSVNVPVVSGRDTRAVTEDLLTTVSILVFEYTGNEYRYAYQTIGYDLTSQTTTSYRFLARITPSVNPLRIYLVGNVQGIGQVLEPGDTEDEMKERLVRSFTEAGFDGVLPMSGYVDFPDGIMTVPAEDINVVMLRSVARADVVSLTDEFIISTVQVFRANNQYQLVPDMIENDRVTVASIPEEATQSVSLNPVIAVEGESIQQIYLPESSLPEVSDRFEATVLVVGGRFGDDAVDTYYRLDFIPAINPELFGQIVRNHLYRFEITGVSASGAITPEKAAENPSTQVVVGVKVWDENTHDMVFNNTSYFGVSSRTIVISAPAGSQRTVEVDTNVPGYLLYWTDAQGNIDESIEPIAAGDSFSSSNGVYTVSISEDGTEIIIVGNRSGATETAYLLVVAGPLELQLTIQQRSVVLSNRALNVYGRVSGIGNLGDSVFGTTQAGDRARGMVAIMRNKANFGPDGVVSVPQINNAGLTDEFISAELMSIFDVMYLTYSNNPGPIYTNRILNWYRTNDKKVLIVQFDDTGTNTIILDSLGVTAGQNVTLQTPYTLSEYAPDVITSGVFGTVNTSLSYRCYDTTHREITIENALNSGITPILIGGGGGVVLGIDFNRRIVFSGDIDLYSNLTGGVNEYLSSGGDVENNAEKLIANLWAWITTVALTE